MVDIPPLGWASFERVREMEARARHGGRELVVEEPDGKLLREAGSGESAPMLLGPVVTHVRENRVDDVCDEGT